MVERVIKPVTKEGRVTIPKELREEYNIKDYVEIIKTKEGLLIKAL